MNILAIDTSIQACGVAFYEPSRAKGLFAKTLRTSTIDGNLNVRCRALAHKYNVWSREMWLNRPDVVLIEMPTFQDSNRGRIAAAGGGLIKLGYVAGYFSKHFNDCNVHLIPPAKWKGCLSKEVTQRRLTKHKVLGWIMPPKLDHNALDAVGMIAWWLDRAVKPVNKSNPITVKL